MSHRHPRTPGNGGVSLYRHLPCRSVAVVALAFLSIAVAARGQTLASQNPRDLLLGGPGAFIDLLEAARPAPLSKEDIEAIVRALPPEGAVTTLAAPAQDKVDAVRHLLTATRRNWYQIRVIDLPQTGIVVHARAVVLVSAPAVALLSAAELQAAAAHEIGHEYVWTEWHRAHGQADQKRLRELELVCDAIAIVTLREVGMDWSRLIDAFEKIARFNRDRFETAISEANYPTIAERRAFAHQIGGWYSSERRRPPEPAGGRR
jgi:hypothetical protein